MKVMQREEARDPLCGSETILLVDDDVAVRALIHEVLTEHGCIVLQAGDGREALECCRQHPGPIHLLLSDVVMPGMSARELAVRVKALRPEIRLLFMSGHLGSSLIRQGVLESDTPFLQKPVTPEALWHKVREVLNGPR